ncbi:hypothetical protein IAU60_000262 [Kwoniella sp. DSM 27419]
MTRTERNQYPAAMQKDRHSRSGLSKTELAHKGGDGAHNWGSHRHQGADEAGGVADADAEREMFNLDEDQLAPLHIVTQPKPSDAGNDIRGDVEGNIARSPSDSMSSIDSASSDADAGTGAKPILGGRRMSNVSDAERDQARSYREGLMNKGGVDLANIARTSYGVAQSPPTNQYIGTSPTKARGGFSLR